MTVLVLEAAALVEFLVGSGALADRVRTFTSGRRLAAPHAVDLECAALLHRLAEGGKVPAGEATRALSLLGRMRLHRYDTVPLLPRIWQLRYTLPPYDAACAALAEALGGELLALDPAAFTAIDGLGCPIRHPIQP